LSRAEIRGEEEEKEACTDRSESVPRREYESLETLVAWKSVELIGGDTPAP
jgi:hypothetical protein